MVWHGTCCDTPQRVVDGRAGMVIVAFCARCAWWMTRMRAVLGQTSIAGPSCATRRGTIARGAWLLHTGYLTVSKLLLDLRTCTE